MGDIVVETLTRGSVLALLAVGLTLVYGVSRFANVAAVEYATLAAYGLVLTGSVVGVSLLPAALASVASVGLLSVLLYRLVFVRLLVRSVAVAMIGSLALSILLRALIQTITGPAPKQLDLPLERGLDLLGSPITPSQLRMALISAAALALLMVGLRVTPLGRSMRAVSANPDLAAAAGINTRRIADMVWLIAGALGALAGILLAIDTQVSLQMGFNLLLPVFAVALLGGFGSPAGAIFAAYLLAAVEASLLRVDFGELFGGAPALISTSYRPAIGFLLLLVVLLWRPQGLFGRRPQSA